MSRSRALGPCPLLPVVSESFRRCVLRGVILGVGSRSLWGVSFSVGSRFLWGVSFGVDVGHIDIALFYVYRFYRSQGAQVFNKLLYVVFNFYFSHCPSLVCILLVYILPVRDLSMHIFYLHLFSCFNISCVL